MKTLTVPANMESMERVTGFIEETLEEAGCPIKLVMKLNIAADEIFSNIARYSGASEATVSCGVEGGSASISFLDDGAPFNPLEQAAPDTGLPAEERSAGGLGIHLVRAMMDRVSYAYQNEKNILTIQKTLDVSQ